MCAILDRNKFGEFRKPTEEGRLFREWVEEGGGRIIYLVNDRPKRLPAEIAEDMRRLFEEYDESPNVGAIVEPVSAQRAGPAGEIVRSGKAASGNGGGQVQ